MVLASGINTACTALLSNVWATQQDTFSPRALLFPVVMWCTLYTSWFSKPQVRVLCSVLWYLALQIEDLQLVTHFCCQQAWLHVLKDASIHTQASLECSMHASVSRVSNVNSDTQIALLVCKAGASSRSILHFRKVSMHAVNAFMQEQPSVIDYSLAPHEKGLLGLPHRTVGHKESLSYKLSVHNISFGQKNASVCLELNTHFPHPRLKIQPCVLTQVELSQHREQVTGYAYLRCSWPLQKRWLCSAWPQPPAQSVIPPSSAAQVTEPSVFCSHKFLELTVFVLIEVIQVLKWLCMPQVLYNPAVIGTCPKTHTQT